MYNWFEKQIDPLQEVGGNRPPETLGQFYWHYIEQVKPWLIAIMVVGLFAALIEVSLLAFLGKFVDLMREASSPETFFSDHGTMLMIMAFVALIARPIVFALHTMLINQTVSANLTSLIRWQSYRYVLRQSLGFFQNDFAGRIANKIMMTGPSLNESVIGIVDAMWFVMIYTVSAMVLFFQNDPRLILPMLIWLIAYGSALYYFVPKVKNQAAVMSEMRSQLMGRVVDSYTNILTVKLFAHADQEDKHVSDALLNQTQEYHKQLRLLTSMEVTIVVINGLQIVASSGLALWLWSQGAISLGAIALAIALVVRMSNMSHWIMWVTTGIFRDLGTVQEGMETISKLREVRDAAGAQPLRVTKGHVRFENVGFHYGKIGGGIIDDLTLDVKPGEKIGVVGRSGAGKSTLVNILLRFYDLEKGRILIDGQDIAKITQDSLRDAIGIVTQDTSLLHRSIRDNILYGNTKASEEQVINAAKKAQAHEFILDLEDAEGRRGYDAHVGERGVKLSGGQRQRVAIARVLLKNAPILILDEATSALDSEIEITIQEQLYNLMEGKSVIAIAHRLSTIAAMDRLVIMDKGRIIEQGTHKELIGNGGLYAQLWSHQSGGFLTEVR